MSPKVSGAKVVDSSEQPGMQLRAVDIQESPTQFFDDYVVPRKPALFAAQSSDLAHLKDLWTDDYLKRKAGAAVLQVEQRGSAAEGFGKGHKVEMTLRQALDRMSAGDASLYLTTQDVKTAADGHPHLYASPVAELAGDVPLVPRLMGGLVPQSINLWMGAARDGSSTGLHTDYHDNLYVLLRGRKRFRLYPPELVKRMYTVGKVAAVHPNGRIVFKGQGDILPDGSEASEAKQWLRRHKAEQELAAAEVAVEQGLPGAAKRLRAAEKRLDAVLEAALGDDFDGMMDDFDALEEAAAPPQPPAPATAGDPASFSRVDLDLPDAQLHRRFPLFPGKAAALVCEVHAGQMLYLPAGWFHEVTSYSDPASGSNIHLALNFWYHPPDNLGGGGATAMQQPYRHAFWPTVWDGRRAEYEARHLRPTPPQQQPEQQPQQPQLLQQQQQGQEAEQQSNEAVGKPLQLRKPTAALGPLPQFYGLFGVGRRQHLHRFITGKRKSL